jgi:hypothetical protein
MEYRGKQCVVEVWDVTGAAVKASFKISAVITEFQSILEKFLAKKGLSVSRSGAGAPIHVCGRFVRIDEGNQFLRYLLAFFAGKAGYFRTQAVAGELGRWILPGDKRRWTYTGYCF